MRASGIDIVNQLAPQLANAADRTMRQKTTTVRLRSILFLSMALVTIVLVPCAFTYAAGLNAGRFQGEAASHLISVAMKAGPAEALAWGQLIQDNNGASALALCHKNLQQDADGPHYCLMPVWTDPVSPAVP